MLLTNCVEEYANFKVGEFVQREVRHWYSKLVFPEVLQQLSGGNMSGWLTGVGHKRGKATRLSSEHEAGHSDSRKLPRICNCNLRVWNIPRLVNVCQPVATIVTVLFEERAAVYATQVSTCIVQEDRLNKRISALTKLSETESGVDLQGLLFCQGGTDAQAKLRAWALSAKCLVTRMIVYHFVRKGRWGKRPAAACSCSVQCRQTFGKHIMRGVWQPKGSSPLDE
jgi:hypothetical protein